MNSTSNSKCPFCKLSKREIVIVLVLVAAFTAGSWLPERIIVATSDSLDHRIFFKVPVDPEKIEAGDHLLFRLQGEEFKTHISKGLKPNDVLIKKVGCVPGEILKIRNDAFYCGEKNLGTILKKDSKGKELPVFSFTGPIPADHYFMMGTNPRSFDSRYFGLIHANDFIWKAIPIW